MNTIIKTISRRQFFGKAVIGAVGIAAVPFMPWEALAKLFKKSVPLVMDIDVARLGNEWTYITLREIYSTDRVCRWAIKGYDLVGTAKYVKACIKEIHPQSIAIYRAGIGAGLIDLMRIKNPEYNIIELVDVRLLG